KSRWTRPSWTGGPGRLRFLARFLPKTDHHWLSRQIRHAVRWDITSPASAASPTTACLLSSCVAGLPFCVDEPTMRVVRRPVGDDRALAACSTSLVRKASAGSPAGRRADHLPLPVRDRLARRAQRFRSLAYGVQAPP